MVAGLEVNLGLILLVSGDKFPLYFISPLIWFYALD